MIERDEDNRYASQARLLGVRVIVGDATLAPHARGREPLDRVGRRRA